MKKKVLLTGAAGFIGSQLARHLLNEGHEVIALVSPTSRRRRIADIEDRLVIIDSDLRNLSALSARLEREKPDICLHLAWHGWAGQASADANLSSLSVSFDLLKLMPSIGCDRFVATGTCFEYDLANPRLSEATPLKPANLYALAKKVYFDVASEFSEMSGIRFVEPRLFYSYGPFEDTRRVVPAIALALLNGEPARATRGEQVRDYLHSEDVATAIWAAATSDLIGPVNIASGEPITIARIATLIGEILGRPELVELGAMPYREGDPMQVLADATLLRSGLAWTPRYDIESGLRQTLDWWRSELTAAEAGLS